MLNEPISDDEQVGLSKKQLLKLKKANNQAKQSNQQPNNQAKPSQSNQQPNNQAKPSQSIQQPNNQAKPSQSNNKNDKFISPKKDSENSEDSEQSESSYDPFEEAKKRARAKILTTTKNNICSSPEPNPKFNPKINPKINLNPSPEPNPKFNPKINPKINLNPSPEPNPDFNLSPRELFKKAISYDDDNQNKLAIKYYILCIKKYLEENKNITMKFIRTSRNAFGNLAILLDIEEIKTDFIEIGYKFGICGGNSNLLHCYAEYSRNKAYLLEYLLVSKLEPTSEDFILWKELTEESLFKELSLFSHDILNEKLKLINH